MLLSQLRGIPDVEKPLEIPSPRDIWKNHFAVRVLYLLKNLLKPRSKGTRQRNREIMIEWLLNLCGVLDQKIRMIKMSILAKLDVLEISPLECPYTYFCFLYGAVDWYILKLYFKTSQPWYNSSMPSFKINVYSILGRHQMISISLPYLVDSVLSHNASLCLQKTEKVL